MNAMDFNINIPLKKDAKRNDYLIGIASTLSMDRDQEKMSEKALYDMQREIQTNGVNLFGNHEHNWENTLGVVKDAKIENNQLKVGIQLDDPATNPKVNQMLAKLNRGIKLGLSVGGFVTSEKEEYNQQLKRKTKIIDGVQLYEISLVGVPSNADTFISLPAAIAKSRGVICPACYSKIITNKCATCGMEAKMAKGKDEEEKLRMKEAEEKPEDKKKAKKAKDDEEEIEKSDEDEKEDKKEEKKKAKKGKEIDTEDEDVEKEIEDDKDEKKAKKGFDDDEEDEDDEEEKKKKAKKTKKGEQGGLNPEESESEAAEIGGHGNQHNPENHSSSIDTGRNASGKTPGEESYTGKSASVDLKKSPLFVELNTQIEGLKKSYDVRIEAMEKSLKTRLDNIQKTISEVEKFYNKPLHKGFNENVGAEQVLKKGISDQIKDGNVRYTQ